MPPSFWSQTKAYPWGPALGALLGPSEPCLRPKGLTLPFPAPALYSSVKFLPGTREPLSQMLSRNKGGKGRKEIPHCWPPESILWTPVTHAGKVLIDLSLPEQWQPLGTYGLWVLEQNNSGSRFLWEDAFWHQSRQLSDKHLGLYLFTNGELPFLCVVVKVHGQKFWYPI